ncbi:MAG TPA: fluoride efflux transporter CrcB [Nitrolancea sp.]|nr:fluoride efflux transporter CrcB [Nitrolancea sp.]
MNILLVAVGGAIGATARYLLGGWIQGWVGSSFPWGTLVINVSGSLIIGLVLGLVDRGALSSQTRLLLAVGVLGGYTTFSTFSYEGLQMLQSGSYGSLLVYQATHLGLGLLAASLGLIMARAIV